MNGCNGRGWRWRGCRSVMRWAINFFMHADIALSMIRNRALPKEPWRFTDDTNMALSLYHNLTQYGEIKQDELAAEFCSSLR